MSRVVYAALDVFYVDFANGVALQVLPYRLPSQSSVPCCTAFFKIFYLAAAACGILSSSIKVNYGRL